MEKNIPELFGSSVFTDKIMRDKLPKDMYKALRKTIDNNTHLELDVANAVAVAMKEWAVENGATHFTHWFQPMTGYTAEKHDSFICPVDKGEVIMDFSGKELVKGEPDASSFPSGGIRATFEARGYTAWDPTSPAFIKDGTLYIPTAFCSYSGEALDKKTPLLRSMDAISREAVKVLKLLGKEDVTNVLTTVGPEQEYFLIDIEDYKKRKDLIFTGRTLLGAPAPKGQEMDDHYFGNLKPRVAAYMHDLDEELWKLGIPAKTKHNEVAPSQHELAPVFDTTNVAVDHNQLTMEIMKKVAEKHGYVCLLHEKPFAGINGSGKHNNWSLCTDTGINLFAPGKNPQGNILFLTFLVNVLMMVYKNQDLLRASIMSATNCYRLGANEAPPVILSIFLGKQLTAVLDEFVKQDYSSKSDKAENLTLKLGIDRIPEILLDTTDRNRTSPFAFTGNRFEFRAVGSSANNAGAMIAINAAMANQLQEFRATIDSYMEEGMTKTEALFYALKEAIIESAPIHFEGDGYSEEWKQEAAKRGLSIINNVPEALMQYKSRQSRAVLIGEHIFNEIELASRLEVELEKFTKKVQIESRVLGDMANNHIIPTAVTYQNRLLENLRGLRETFDIEEYKVLSAECKDLIREISFRITDIKRLVKEMVDARKKANLLENYQERAFAYEQEVKPYLEQIRVHIDKLEMEIDDEIWPLPKYRELLFTK
jgi:glutamine synthetase